MKTRIDAEDGRPDLTITREFELPVELLFKAYTEAELLEQWMGTKVLKLETKRHGSYQFETTAPNGSKLRFNGVFHQFEPDLKITRTSEFEGMPFGIQLEFLEFEKLSEDTSRLTVHSIYRSASLRDLHLQMPFRFGLNMAHNQLEEIVRKLK